MTMGSCTRVEENSLPADHEDDTNVQRAADDNDDDDRSAVASAACVVRACVRDARLCARAVW